jgi:hypothetical protein
MQTKQLISVVEELNARVQREEIVKAKPGDDLFIAGRYLDRYEKCDGECRITDCSGVQDWAKFSAGDDRGFKNCPPDHLGRRDKNDAVST